MTDQSDLQHYYLETKYHLKTKSISQIQSSCEKTMTDDDYDPSDIKKFNPNTLNDGGPLRYSNQALRAKLELEEKEAEADTPKMD